MRPLADLGHSAYDTLEFVKEHYPEMVQMYETIMAHLKVPEGNPVVEPSEPTVITDAFEPEPYMIKGRFNSVILDSDIITALGYTSDDYSIIAKRAGLIYLGMYNRTYTKTFFGEDMSTLGSEEVTVQAPQFAIIKPRYQDESYNGEPLFSIPKAHSLDRVLFSTATECSITYEGNGGNTIYDFVIKESGDDWRTDYSDFGDEYLCHRHIYHTAQELQFNILIGLGDNIKLPEVM